MCIGGEIRNEIVVVINSVDVIEEVVVVGVVVVMKGEGLIVVNIEKIVNMKMR